MHFFKYCCWDIGRSHRFRLPPKDREKFSEIFFLLAEKETFVFWVHIILYDAKRKIQSFMIRFKSSTIYLWFIAKKLHCEPNLISVAWSCGNQVHENMISRAYIRAWFEWVHAISIKMWVISLWLFFQDFESNAGA